MIDYLDTIPYLLLLGLLMINMKINSKASNNLCFLIIFIFSAIRYNVGFDFMMYFDILKNDPYYDRFEFFEYLLQRLAAETYIPLFFIINSFITVYFVKWAIENMSANVSISLFAFFCIPLLYTHSFSIIRFWAGVSILFYGSTFLFKKKWIHFAIFYVISIFFHGSMIVGILFVPLILFDISRIVNIIFLIISFIGGEFVLSHILQGSLMDYKLLGGDRFMRYANLGITGDAMTKLPYIYLAIDIIFLILWPRTAKRHNKTSGKTLKDRNSATCKKYITLYNLGVCILFLLSFDTTLNTRLCRPFLVYIILLIPLILQRFRRQNRQLATFAFTLAASALFLYTITIYNDTLGKSEYLPYRIIFLENY